MGEKMGINERIEKAKKSARINAVIELEDKELDSEYTSKEREWAETTSENDKKSNKRRFVLEGTPDKALVIAELDTGKVDVYDDKEQLTETLNPGDED